MMTPIIDFHTDGLSRGEALRALLKLYPRYSLKRRLLLFVNSMNVALPRRMPESLRSLLASKLFRFEASRLSKRAWLLHKVNQNGRVYVFDFGGPGEVVSVTKIALTKEAAVGLKKEHEILTRLAKTSPSFWFGEIVGFSLSDDFCALQTSAVPFEFSPHRKSERIPENLFDAIGDLRPATMPVEVPAHDLGGWQSAMKSTKTRAIHEIARGVDPHSMFAVSGAHRDLGSENVFSRSPSVSVEDFALIDWEFYTDTAPALTDKVGVWLGCRHRSFKGGGPVDVDRIANHFLRDFSGGPGGEQAAVLALLHLADLGIDLAQMLTGDRQ